MGDILEAILSVLIIGLGVYARNRKKKNKALMKKIREEVAPVYMEEESEALPPAPTHVVTPLPAAAPVAFTPAAPRKAEEPKTESLREGQDPCHDDMFPEREEAPVLSDTDAAHSALGRELVRGFVIGEILATPRYKTRK